MIPSVLAGHVEQGIKDFLRTTFPVTTPFFSNILENFLIEPGNVFKGPFLDIQLPFQQGKGGGRSFLDSFGSPFVINTKINWMPNFYSGSRTPSFLTTRRGSRFDQISGATSSRSTWYQSWITKCLCSDSLFVISAPRELYDLVLKELVSRGVLMQKSVKGDTVWGVRPEALRVSSQVRQFRCRSCRHNISVAEEESKVPPNVKTKNR